MAVQADLIVMTSHGRTGMARWMLGSVAAELAREAQIPVFILRSSTTTPPTHQDDARRRGGPQAEEEIAAGGQALSALMPLDGSPLAEAALSPALQPLQALAGDAPLELHLLSIVEPLPLTTAAPFGGGVAAEGHALLTEVDSTMLGEAEQYLCATAERVQREVGSLTTGRSVAITWAAVWSPDVAHSILPTGEAGTSGEGSAGQTGALPPSDLIAMATHGYGGLRRWIMGSVADRVLHATSLPMLVVRPTGVHHAEAPDTR